MKELPILTDKVGELIYDIQNESLEQETELLCCVMDKHGNSYQAHIRVIKSTDEDFIDWEDNVPHFQYVDGALFPVK